MEHRIIQSGDVRLDSDSRAVRRADREVKLNRKEFSLLEYLMQNPRVALTRLMILEHVWGIDVDPFTNTVDVHIRYLRRKIDDGFEHKVIATVHGIGYKFEPEY